MWRPIKKTIHNHQRFLLTTHMQPDADGIGAATALMEMLLSMGKEVKLVCDSPIPEQFAFLNYHGLHEIYDPNQKYDPEVFIILDAHKKNRVGRIGKIANRKGVTTIVIDHHEVDEIFTPYAVIDPHACCVGAMIYTLYKECGYDLNKEAAQGIYASIICDTGRFCYSSTDRKSHKIADECMKVGVDPDEMFARLYKHVTIAELRMFGRALQHMETYFDERVVVQEIRREDYEGISGQPIDIENVDLDYIHDVHHQIQNLECFVLLRELTNDQVRVSMRSKTDLDIGRVMRALGGGGHKNAAGVTWNGNVDEVKEKILHLLGEVIKNNLSD